MKGYNITDRTYKSIKPQPYKRVKLRKGDSIVLTTLDRLIYDVIYLFLTMQEKKIATRTEIYSEVRRVLNYPSLRSDKIKSIIFIMYIKHKIGIKHRINNKYQTQFRDYVKLL